MLKLSDHVFCYAGTNRDPFEASIDDMRGFFVRTIQGPVRYRRLCLPNGTTVHWREDHIFATMNDLVQFITRKGLSQR